MTNTASYLDYVFRGSMAAFFTIAGAMKLTAHPFEVQSFEDFGYAPWFMSAIGALEFLGGFALLRTQWVLPTLMLLGTIIIGAIGSHLHAEDAAAHMVPAFVVLLILTGIGLIHRPLRATQAA